MSKVLYVTPSKCTGCKTCEVSCAFAHPAGAEPGVSRTRVHATGAGTPGSGMPVVCLQCEHAGCVASCPANALWRDKELGMIHVVEDRCIRCASCVAACPFGCMHWDASATLPLKCDLCKGEPKCAKYCPSGALQYR